MVLQITMEEKTSERIPKKISKPEYSVSEVKLILSRADSVFDAVTEINKKYFIFNAHHLGTLYRNAYVKNISWAVPSAKTLKQIFSFVQKCDTIMDVFAGNGLWAHLFEWYGFTVIASDKKVNGKDHAYADVQCIDCVHAVTTHNGVVDVLFICWPPRDDPCAYKALSAFKGNKVIFIGYSYGCVTGDDDLQKEFREQWELVAKHNVQCWSGVNDSMYFYIRQTKTTC